VIEHAVAHRPKKGGSWFLRGSQISVQRKASHNDCGGKKEQPTENAGGPGHAKKYHKPLLADMEKLIIKVGGRELGFTKGRTA
jgi:hypothetical protein